MIAISRCMHVYVRNYYSYTRTQVEANPEMWKVKFLKDDDKNKVTDFDQTVTFFDHFVFIKKCFCCFPIQLCVLNPGKKVVWVQNL